jgi:hypothetical protein
MKKLLIVPALLLLAGCNVHVRAPEPVLTVGAYSPPPVVYRTTYVRPVGVHRPGRVYRARYY